MQKGNKRGVVFRRIGGRIVPMRVKKEASAVAGVTGHVATNKQARMSAGKALAYTAAGLALGFGAGRLKRLSELALKASPKSFKGEAFERIAKLGDFAAKAGSGALVGHEITKIDRGTTKDERSKLLNIGAQGKNALQIGAGLIGGYALYRTTKRFQKWGYKGGKFPWKLRDL